MAYGFGQDSSDDNNNPFAVLMLTNCSNGTCPTSNPTSLKQSLRGAVIGRVFRSRTQAHATISG